MQDAETHGKVRFMNTKILLTGGAGYIGLHTVLALQDAGYTPVIVDDLSRGRPDLVPTGVTLHNVSITDTNALTNVCLSEKPAAIVHLAALLSVEESTKIPLDYYNTNVAGTLSVCRAMDAAKIPHLVFSSTCCVYGDMPSGVQVSENTPRAPYSPYGKSKAMAEQIIEDAHAQMNLSYVILRYFNVAGADTNLRAGPYTENPTLLIDRVSQVIGGALPNLTVNGTDYPTPDGTAVRDYIHVADIAGAHVAALKYLDKGGASAAFNCGYGRGLSVKQILDTAKKVSGVDFPVVYGPRRDGDVAMIAANTSGIRDVMGWEPQHDDLDQMISSALHWYRHATGR